MMIKALEEHLLGGKIQAKDVRGLAAGVRGDTAS